MMRSSQESSSQPGSILYSLINCISTNFLLYFSSFKRLAKETHPDRPNGDKEQFQKLQMAFMRALKTIEVCKTEEKKDKMLNLKVERQGSLCMACYVREMDLWRDRKEEGDPGLVRIDCIKI